MNSNASYLSYRETGAFSKLVSDYIDVAEALQPFFEFTPDIQGVKKAIAARHSDSGINRQILTAQLTGQYAGIETSVKVKENIQALANGNVYTICTAHQPNLFTGHLYFVYKILHAIKLADTLQNEIPDTRFVPVFYMGSEDADLEELGQISIHGKILNWQTHQKGSVGRMLVDGNLIALIDEIEGQLSVLKYGGEISALLRNCYVKGRSIEQSTFLFINELFKDFGLVVLLPDNAGLKRLFNGIVVKELANQFSSKAVRQTIADFPPDYKVQAAGRDINLFYLKDDVRERIERSGEGFLVANTQLKFTLEEMVKELESFPERFSPNVITRPLYQETILPNIAFIGGGAELAYWLELKNVFQQAGVLFPLLILRNSFSIISQQVHEKMKTLHLSAIDFFENEHHILAGFVKRNSSAPLTLSAEKKQLADVYTKIENLSNGSDPTLKRHVKALSAQALHRLDILEKKLLKVEKRKFEVEQRQINKIRSILFPGGILQERVDNLLPYYAMYGRDFLQAIYDNSKSLEMEYCVLTLEN